MGYQIKVKMDKYMSLANIINLFAEHNKLVCPVCRVEYMAFVLLYGESLGKNMLQERPHNQPQVR